MFAHSFNFKSLLFLSLLIGCLGSTTTQAQMDTVLIENGLISGISKDGFSVFKGIPYATPPVGKYRWKAPLLANDWTGVLPTKEFSPACMQIPPPEGSFYQVEFYPEPEPTSEDCLYLNIWSGAESTKQQRPVMVWIHGGAFSQGSGSMPTFNGGDFAKKGVVLVTINYRLGIIGLFAHPELSGESIHYASGNYGLLDQVAALEWVQQNIAAFGGNPNNVTVFGQSSGAGNINKLMASPMAKGLFHRAILQSGSAYTFGKTSTLRQMEQRGEDFANEYKISSVQELRTWPADTLLERSRGVSFSPNIDGGFLPDEPQAVFARGAQHPVPVLAGSTEDEGSTFFGPQFNAEIFRNIINRSFGEEAEAFLNLYPHQTDEEARTSYTKSWKDDIAWGAHMLAKVHSQTTHAKVYLYHFRQIPPGRNSERYGSFHSSEIAYVFQTLDAVNRPWTETDHQLANTIARYWVNFATTGNPNGEHVPNWPIYDPKKRTVQILDNEIMNKVILSKEILNFYTRQYMEAN